MAWRTHNIPVRSEEGILQVVQRFAAAASLLLTRELLHDNAGQRHSQLVRNLGILTAVEHTVQAVATIAEVLLLNLPRHREETTGNTHACIIAESSKEHATEIPAQASLSGHEQNSISVSAFPPNAVTQCLCKNWDTISVRVYTAHSSR